MNASFGAWALAFVLFATTTPAQPRLPHIAYLYPAGGQRGTTVMVSLGGQALSDAKAVYVSGAGVQAKVVDYSRPLAQKEINELRERLQQLQDKRSAKKEPFTPEDEKAAADLRGKLASRASRQVSPALAETVTLEIALAPDATPGTRELRIRTTSGLSNPFVFVIGQLPEITDPVVTATNTPLPRPNRAPEIRATPKAQPSTAIALPAIANGQILPGEVDSFHFTAHKGQRVVARVSARALNPYLADAVPGWFQATLGLYDARGRELAYDDDYQFDPDPALTAEIPADGEYVLAIKDAIYRGREDFVYRITVGELPFVTSIYPLGGPIAGTASFDLAGWNLPSRQFLVDTKASEPGIYGIGVCSGVEVSSLARFELDRLPECAEQAEGAGLDDAQMLTLPVIVNGRIEQPGEQDVFRFAGRAEQMIVAEVFARRLGSPLDSVLRLVDAHGKQLAGNDDYEDRGAALLTHHADSRISFVLPADGMYDLQVADAQRHGGLAYGYRLHVGPPRPDFALRVVPSSINVRAGGTVPVTVYALRRDGFAGEIALGLRGGPPGFLLSGARIPAGQDKITVTLTAPNASRDEPFDVEFVGMANPGERRLVHVATPADDLMQAFAYHHLVPAKELQVCVAGRGATLRPVAKPPIQIAASGSTHVTLSLPVAIGRSSKNVHVELAEAPSGITVKRSALSGDVIDIELICDSAKAKAGDDGNLLFTVFGERSAAKPGSTGQRMPLGSVPAIRCEVIAAKTYRRPLE